MKILAQAHSSVVTCLSAIHGLPILFLDFTPVDEVQERLVRDAQEHGGEVASDEAFPLLSRTDRLARAVAATAEEFALATEVAEILSLLPFDRMLPIQGYLTAPDGRRIKVQWPVSPPRGRVAGRLRRRS